MTFLDESSDLDGTIGAWDWDFGDGTDPSTDQNPTHMYAAGGTYSVTLTITDNDGATDTTSQQAVTVSDGSDEIELTATGYKVKGSRNADLAWSGATSEYVDILRNGTKIATTVSNLGSYTDNLGKGGGGSYTYKVCDRDTSNCSEPATVTF